MSQTQFLDVIDRDEAERRFHDALKLRPLGEETIALKEALPDCAVGTCAVGTDVIAGFPGETERQFNNTVSLVEELFAERRAESRREEEV